MHESQLASVEASTRGIHAATGLPIWRVWTAATLACVYAVGFAVEAVLVLYLVFTGTGNASVTHQNAFVFKGAIELGLILAAAAVYSVLGAVRLVRLGRRAMLIVPLSLLLVFGTIGECIDLAGTASGVSDLIGGAILVGAALPIALLVAPVRRS